MSEKKEFKCQYCERILKSKSGLVSHEKSCKSKPVNLEITEEIVTKNEIKATLSEVEDGVIIGEASKEVVEEIKKKVEKAIINKEPKHITLLKRLIDSDGNVNLTGNTLEQLHTVYVTLYNKPIDYKCNNQARTMIASLKAYRLERL